jgi:hypothetical protein
MRTQQITVSGTVFSWWDTSVFSWWDTSNRLDDQAQDRSGCGCNTWECPDVEKHSVQAVVDTAKRLPEGDVLLVGPIASSGNASDGKVLTKNGRSFEYFCRRED